MCCPLIWVEQKFFSLCRLLKQGKYKYLHDGSWLIGMESALKILTIHRVGGLALPSSHWRGLRCLWVPRVGFLHLACFPAAVRPMCLVLTGLRVLLFRKRKFSDKCQQNLTKTFGVLCDYSNLCLQRCISSTMWSTVKNSSLGLTEPVSLPPCGALWRIVAWVSEPIWVWSSLLISPADLPCS